MYAVLDIETTGGSPATEKITEIAIFVFDGQRIIDEFSTLINPEKNIPYFITGLTGITNAMVANAPKFYEVARRIVEMTENLIVVGHNVNFDYGFIQQEFLRLGYEYTRDRLCTVKLSRKLLPGHKSYSLGTICERLNIGNSSRHRAAGDALATVELLSYLLKINNGDCKVLADVASQTYKGLNSSFNCTIPATLLETTGVYYFHDEKGNVIYVGKSRSIRSSVMSHLTNNTSRRAIQMKEQLVNITFEHTGSELLALLLESYEIKRIKPIYNRAQGRTINQYGIYRVFDDMGYIRIHVAKNTSSKDALLFSFETKKEALDYIYKMVDVYKLCQKLAGVYDSSGACFHYEINQCNGACIGKEDPEIYNSRLEEAIGSFTFDNKNLFIVDKGRSDEESAIVKIQNGKYMGFGFITGVVADFNVNVLNDCIQYYDDNRDTNQIIRSFLAQNIARIIEY